MGVERDEEGLARDQDAIREREDFWRNVRVLGHGRHLNQELERAGRIADYLELAELMALDALDRDESAGDALPFRAPDPGRRGRA